MTTKTVQIKKGSQTQDYIQRGIEHFGDNYRHKHMGQFYKIVGFSDEGREYFNLKLESIL